MCLVQKIVSFFSRFPFRYSRCSHIQMAVIKRFTANVLHAGVGLYRRVALEGRKEGWVSSFFGFFLNLLFIGVLLVGEQENLENICR